MSTSTEKVTPVPRAKGTPKRMHPRVLRVSYFVIAVMGVFQIVAGLYLAYNAEILNSSAFSLSLNPLLVAVVEFFAGVFAIVAALGLRRLAYWGILSGIIFGVFGFWNYNLLSQVVQSDLSKGLGISLSASSTNNVGFVFLGISILIVVLSAFSVLGVRQHRKMTGLMKA